MPYRLKSHRGYNLLELTMALAIGAILILIVGATSDYLLTARRTLAQNASTIQLVHLSRILLADRQTCTENLRTLRLSTSEPQGTVVSLLSERTDGSSPAARIAVSGTVSDGYTVTEMRILPKAQVSFDKMLVDFRFKITMDRVIGSREKEQSFPLLARIVNDQVIECMAIEQDSDSLTKADICLFVTGSRKYDASTGRCLNPQVQCFSGTHTSASCGPGFVLKTGEDACAVQTPAGFVDTSPSFNTAYGDTTRLWRPAVGLGRRASATSCICDYAVDAPGTISGATCSACCVSADDP